MKKILFSFILIISVQSIYTQCSVTATVLTDSVNCNEAVEISLVGIADTSMGEFFGPTGPSDPNWVSTSGAVFTNPFFLPSPTNDTYFWMGTSPILPTALTSASLSVPNGGNICFDFVYAVQGDPSPTEGPDEYDEGITLQYSTDNGVTWNDIVYYAPNGDILPSNPQVDAPNVSAGPSDFNTWTSVCMPIPTGAETNNTSFQWIQEEHSSASNDHWGLDNIYITGPDPDYVLIDNTTGANIGNSPGSVIVNPVSNPLYTFTYIDTASGAGTMCQTSIIIYNYETDAGEPQVVSCSTLGVELNVTGIDPTSSVVWSPSTGLSDPNSHNPLANPTVSQTYTVTSDCGVDAVSVVVVPLFEAYVTATEDSICVGETTNLIATSDQDTNSYTYSWSPSNLTNDTIDTTIAFPNIPTMYYLEMVSDSGCIRQDSIMIHVGAAPKTINYIGDMRICRGDSTEITVVPKPVTFYDDFNISANSSIWVDIQNGTANTDCGSVSGNALHFDGIGNRWAQLYPVDASLGGDISFMLIYGSSTTFGDPCADVSTADGMSLEYSIDNGLTWVIINTYASNDYNNWTTVQDTIPILAQTTHTIFRLNQGTHSGQDRDNWAIENFLLELNCSGISCVQYDYVWSPITDNSNPTSATTFLYPDTTAYYSVSISPQGFDCATTVDSILISVDELQLSVSPQDTFLCESNPIFLDGEIEGYIENCNGEYTLTNIPFYTESGIGIDTILAFDSADDGEIIVSLPFTFEFFCAPVSSVIVQTNGVVNMQDNGGGNDDWSNDQIPNLNTPNGFIALLWDDLQDNSNTSSYFVTGVAPDRKFVIAFDVQHRTAGPAVQGQVILHETTNIIDLSCINCYQDATSPSATQGIENYNGTDGVVVPGRNNTVWTSINETWRFIPTHSPINFSINWTPNSYISNVNVASPLVAPITSTDYVLNVHNINNCLFTDTAKIQIYESNSSLSSDVSVCSGDAVQLTASGADSYSWSPATGLDNTTIANPTSTINTDITYYVTYTTQTCQEIDSINIDVLTVQNLEINNNINPVNYCEGTEKRLFVDSLNNFSYQWSDMSGSVISNNASVNVSEGGLYTVAYNDGNCNNITNITVNEKLTPIIDFSSFDKTLCCTDDEVTVDLNSIISNNVSVSQILINGILETSNSISYVSDEINDNLTLTFTAISIDDCESVPTILKIEKNCLNPIISGPDTVYFESNTPFTLNTDDNDDVTDITYTWTTTEPDASAIIDPSLQNAVFAGLVESENFYTTQATVTFNPGACEEISNEQTYIVLSLQDPQYPDAFTPNGDGLNDIYSPIVNSLAKTLDLRIYNRWGDMVYDMNSSENKEGWNGEWNGKKQSQDLYMYYIKISHPDGKEFIQEGSVSLIR